MRPSDPVPPAPGQPRGLVNVPVQRDQRLSLLDEAPDGYAAHVHVERNVVDRPAVQCRAVEVRSVGRRVEEEDRSVEVVLPRQPLEVVLDGRVADLALLTRHRAPALLRRDRSRIDEPRHVVSLPVLEQERSRRNVRVAVDAEAVERLLAVVHVVPRPARGRFEYRVLLGAKVVVPEDQVDRRVVLAPRSSLSLWKPATRKSSTKSSSARLRRLPRRHVRRQEVATKEHRVRQFFSHEREQRPIAADGAVKV